MNTERRDKVLNVWGPRKDLMRVRYPERLEALAINTSRLGSLAGIERMGALERVGIASIAGPELGRLIGLTRLVELSIGARGDTDFAPLEQLTSLRTLGVTATTPAAVRSLLATRLEKLEALDD